jgi:hypothetical protein
VGNTTFTLYSAIAVAVSKTMANKYQQTPSITLCPSALTAVGVDEELVLIVEAIHATPI